MQTALFNGHITGLNVVETNKIYSLKAHLTVFVNMATGWPHFYICLPSDRAVFGLVLSQEGSTFTSSFSPTESRLTTSVKLSCYSKPVSNELRSCTSKDIKCLHLLLPFHPGRAPLTVWTCVLVQQPTACSQTHRNSFYVVWKPMSYIG